MTRRYTAKLLRTALLIPLAITVIGAIGFGACRALNLNPHPREMFLAAGACLIVSWAALLPLYLVRGLPQQNVVSIGLASTAIHLLGCLVTGGVLSFAKALALTSAFEFWMLPFFWTTLALVASGVIGAINASVPTVRSNSVPASQA